MGVLGSLLKAGEKFGGKAIAEGSEAATKSGSLGSKLLKGGAKITAGGAAVIGGAALLGGSGSSNQSGSKATSASDLMGNMGSIGDYGSSRFGGGGGSANALGNQVVGVKRISVNENQSTNKLLGIALNFLASLDANIKNQFNLQKAFYNQQARADKEARLEGRGSVNAYRGEPGSQVIKSSAADDVGSGGGILSKIAGTLAAMAIGAYALNRRNGSPGTNPDGSPREKALGDSVLSGIGAGVTGWDARNLIKNSKMGFTPKFDSAGKKVAFTEAQLARLEKAGYTPRGNGFVDKFGKFVKDTELTKSITRGDLLATGKNLAKGATKLAAIQAAFEAADYLISGKKASAGNLIVSGFGIGGSLLGGAVGGFLGTAAGPVGTFAGGVAGGIAGDSVGRGLGQRIAGAFGLKTDEYNQTPVSSQSSASNLYKKGNYLGASGPGLGGNGSTEEAIKFFMSRGWSKEQAAGIVGNLQAESGKNLKINAVGDGGKAYGIAQWHADRQANFERVYGKSIRKANFREQLEFVHWELTHTEKQAGNRLKSANTAGGAATIVDADYERSSGAHRGERIANANALMRGKNNNVGVSTRKGPATNQDWMGVKPNVNGLPAGSGAVPADGQDTASPGFDATNITTSGMMAGMGLSGKSKAVSLSGKMVFGNDTQDVAIKGRSYSDAKVSAVSPRSVDVANDNKTPAPVIVVNNQAKQNRQKTARAMGGSEVPNPGAENSALSYQMYFGTGHQRAA